MRLERLLPLLSVCACANIFGFQDLTGSEAGAPDADAAVEASDRDAAGTDAPADAPVDVALDAPLVCDGGKTVMACGDQCVDIATSSANCGGCGHDCGGGACDLGVCDPVVLRDSLASPVFDIDATNFYFNSGSKVLSCPLAGCVLQPTQVEDTQTTVYGSDSYATIMVAQGNVFYVADPVQNTIRPTLYACSIASCSPMALYNSGLLGGFPGGWARSGDTAFWAIYKSFDFSTCTGPGACSATATSYNAGITSQISSPVPMVADASGFYFVNPTTTALVHCPATGACSAPDTLLATTSGVSGLALAGTTLYVLHSGQEGGIPGGSIDTCPTTGTCTPASFVTKQPYPTLITADSSGVYWFNFDPPLGNGDPNQIVTCPLTGCGGGPRSLATKQSGTTLMRTDASFVYWATGSQILRVAK